MNVVEWYLKNVAYKCTWYKDLNYFFRYFPRQSTDLLRVTLGSKENATLEYDKNLIRLGFRLNCFFMKNVERFKVFPSFYGNKNICTRIHIEAEGKIDSELCKLIRQEINAAIEEYESDK